MTDELRHDIAQDAAWAVQGEGTCDETPLPEWTAVIADSEGAELESLREALRKAQEWAASFPLAGEASHADMVAAAEVYAACGAALSSVPAPTSPKSVNLKPGQPCSHPGCERHFTHPCEGCGRYGAGLASAPQKV